MIFQIVNVSECYVAGGCVAGGCVAGGCVAGGYKRNVKF
jgi:hypothetical protein